MLRTCSSWSVWQTAKAEVIGCKCRRRLLLVVLSSFSSAQQVMWLVCKTSVQCQAVHARVAGSLTVAVLCLPP